MRIDKNTTIRLGDRNIVKIKIGDVVIWQKTTEPVVGPDYFYIENTYAGENTITFTTAQLGTPNSYTYAKSVEYSTDKKNWNTLTFNTSTPQTITIGVGEKLYLRNDSGAFNYYEFASFYTKINTSQNCVVGGNINTLINYNDADNVSLRGYYGCFYMLFKNAKNITDASNLIIPSTNIIEAYCREMFSGCTSLQTAPALPATTLGERCYHEMFYNCTSLVNAPALPATTLATGCYSNMFQGCTSLKTTPELPATTLVSDCYFRMFSGCTALTSAQKLPATTLASSCYYEMFSSCKSLTTAPTLLSTTLADYCYYGMFGYCTSLTTAPALPATTLATGCYSNMFQGCTSLTTAPALPATTLASRCYREMFSNCSKLTTAPTLPATTLAADCYNYMFGGCSKLNSVTTYANNISATNCTSRWLYGVASSGTFNNMGFASFETGASGIPTNWTEVIPPIQSITTVNPDTFTIKSYKTKVNCTSTLTITTTTGITNTRTNSATITVGENTGDTTRTLTETIPYKGSSYQVTIVQTANDVRPPQSWNVVSTGTYPFELNTNGYYESTNKGHYNSYSYATLNYSGFDELVLECINSGESNYNYGIISQPDVQLSESTSDDGATGSTNVFHNFKGQSSTNPVQLTIPSDIESHFITIKFRRSSSSTQGNDSLQFKVIEP